MSLHLDLRVGDEVRIGSSVIKLEQKSGQFLRLIIDADNSVDVRLIKNRSEDYRKPSHSGYNVR